MTIVEVQADRIVGPTHHFAGLGVGNVASAEHAWQPSNPAAAALQGLDKMRLVARLGVPQVILPPHPRPHTDLLLSLGFGDEPGERWSLAAKENPSLLSAAFSCSAMWTANAATVAPGVDCSDRHTHLVVANLSASVHRAIESEQTLADLRYVFGSIASVHPPLLGGTPLRDEGAANHMRLAGTFASQGLHLFVHGDQSPESQKHFARHTLKASRAIARVMGLSEENTFHFKQHPKAIDAGAFHNDVVAASHLDTFIHHEDAFYEPDEALERLRQQFREKTGFALKHIVVTGEQLPLEEAIGTYLFNSQLVSAPAESRPVLICPAEVEQSVSARRLVNDWIDSGLIAGVHYVDLKLSMSGGGGPACLRLRVPIEASQLNQLPASSLWTEDLDHDLRALIHQSYPTHVTIDELADLEFIQQARIATETIRRRIIDG